MDKICIKNINLFGYHGVLPEEKTLGQPFEIDVEVITSLNDISYNDNLSSSIDYLLLYEIVKEEFFLKKYNLIETIGEKISLRLLKINNILSVKIRIRKPNAPINGIFDYVGIEINREK